MIDDAEPEEQQAWRVLSRRELIDARPWLRVWSDDLELPNGQVVDGFSAVELPDYVNIVAVTHNDRIVVLRGYKHAVGRSCLNLPGGYLEPDEPPATAARRELIEETGYVSDDWESLGSFVVDGNRGCGNAHLFLARNAQHVAEPDSGDLEHTEIVLLQVADLWQAMREGEVGVLPNATAISLAIVRLGLKEQ